MKAQQLHGKELSFNNINDTNGALDLLREFEEPTVVAVKHANPCGVGSASSVYDAYMKAYEADPVSIFGGIVVANRGIDAPTAEEINKIFVEIVVAPSYTKEALDILKRKKNIRILLLEDIASELPASSWTQESAGGLLLQEIDNQLLPDMSQLKVVTEKTAQRKWMI